MARIMLEPRTNHVRTMALGCTEMVHLILSRFLLDQKGCKKSSSLKALPIGTSPKSRPSHLAYCFAFCRYDASERRYGQKMNPNDVARTMHEPRSNQGHGQ